MARSRRLRPCPWRRIGPKSRRGKSRHVGFDRVDARYFTWQLTESYLTGPVFRQILLRVDGLGQADEEGAQRRWVRRSSRPGSSGRSCDVLTLILLGAFALGLVALVVMVRRRSLAGFENGFFLTIALVLAGTSALSAALTGVWLYRDAATGLVQGAVTDLKHNGELIEAALLFDVNMTVDEMTGVAAGLGAH